MVALTVFSKAKDFLLCFSKAKDFIFLLLMFTYLLLSKLSKAFLMAHFFSKVLVTSSGDRN